MDKKLPVDGAIASHRQPWLLFSMPVNALNFCPFAMCYDCIPQPTDSSTAIEAPHVVKPILFAVPNAIDSGGVSQTATKITSTNIDRSTYSSFLLAGE